MSGVAESRPPTLLLEGSGASKLALLRVGATVLLTFGKLRVYARVALALPAAVGWGTSPPLPGTTSPPGVPAATGQRCSRTGHPPWGLVSAGVVGQAQQDQRGWKNGAMSLLLGGRASLVPQALPCVPGSLWGCGCKPDTDLEQEGRRSVPGATRLPGEAGEESLMGPMTSK